MYLTIVPTPQGIVPPKTCSAETRAGHLSDVSRDSQLHNAHEIRKELKEMNE